MWGFNCISKKRMFRGMQWIFKFKNGYGASVINDGYGSEEGLYELAVLDSEERIHYDNKVSKGDVQGYLQPKQVAKLLKQISRFKEAKK